ncbi:recombination regulator RecX [Deinococcus irradiatisoli]|uniref:Regulatory protein RecX n=1 Tax=Deinococcus irradiatisoli TaxID=2202254 RepID=A0A2Z3JBT1_9DEIO|nr:RecX family transcriptional regulator [Deinococcus irradiatisoli]AWN22603.1 recombination regulator RecX [Deinococcus irradiatisoli]
MYRSRKRSPDAEPREPKPARPQTPDEQRAALMEYALRALAQRALSAAELRGKLEKRSQNEEHVQGVLSRLTELRYLDDNQVARIEGQRRGVGAYRVQARLKQRGVAQDVIEQTLQERDPDEDLAQARALLERRLSALRRGTNPRMKAYGLLARRGYGGDVIRRALEGMNWAVTDDKGESEDAEWLGEEE